MANMADLLRQRKATNVLLAAQLETMQHGKTPTTESIAATIEAHSDAPIGAVRDERTGPVSLASVHGDIEAAEVGEGDHELGFQHGPVECAGGSQSDD